MQEKFELNNYDNHIIIEKKGQKLFINTGSPLSMGVSDEVELCGKHFNNIGDNIKGYSLNQLQDNLGIPVNYLIGNDILSNFKLFISLKNNELVITDEELEKYSNSKMINCCGFIMGAPIINFNIKDKSYSAIYDSGAKTSFFKGELVSRLKSIGEIEDFNPLLGKFSSSKYNIYISLSKHLITLPCGKLPETIERFLEPQFLSAVIGNHLLKEFEIYIDYNAEIVCLMKL